MTTAELSKPRRLELILRQVDSLPTLPAVATRLLSLTASDESHAREVVAVIESDPALSAKILALCRTADKGVRSDVLTVDQAVVLLGFNAIRNAVLSIKVFELFGPPATREVASGSRTGREEDSPGPSSDSPKRESEACFDRVGFWSHSLAVAILAEMIARAHRHDQELNADAAFVCGLLHDIGKLALDCVLPKAFASVVALAEVNQGNIAELERRVMGLDHHTAGKRLAEQWGLPHMLQDCIWLHGSSYEALPQIEHRRMVGLITLADTVARRQHVGFSGNYTFKVDEDALVEQLGLRPNLIERALDSLHEELDRRGKALGLHETPTRELLMQSIQQANAALGRMNHRLEARGRAALAQGRMLQAISAFHACAVPGRCVEDVLDAVVTSASELFGPGFYAMIYPTKRADNRAAWLVSTYSDEAQPRQAQYVDPPPYSPGLEQLDVATAGGTGVNLMGILPWIADYLVNADDLRQVRLLPLSSGWGPVAVLLHDRAELPPAPVLSALTASWGAAIAGAAQHDGARRLSEQLAEANLALADAQDRLLHHESMARLGEMAAGAAHEMNNPLAVISGRSQLLSMTLPPGSDQQKAAQMIFREAHRLSDLITALHMFAEPPQLNRRPTDMAAVLDAAIKHVRGSQAARDQELPIFLKIKQDLPPMMLDGELVYQTLVEILSNAVQANPEAVQVTGQLESGGSAVMIQVIDDGDGMDPHTLDHALDPFFSAKPAGRRVGMGLSRADQLVKAHGGQLHLRSAEGSGTAVTLSLPLDSFAV